MTDWGGLRMESLVQPDGTAEVSLAQFKVPDPGPDEVIVRMEAAPINPSDLRAMFAFGDVDRAEFGGSDDRPLITVPLSPEAFKAAGARVGKALPFGNEGAGTVVAVGSGEAAQALDGRLVAVVGGGTYSEYCLVAASACLPLPEGTSAAQGAASYINPMTALGMIETMRAEGYRALVHTAAASSVGQMLVRLCTEEGIPLVNIVRSPAQVALLHDAGASYVCDSSSDEFESELTVALQETGATLAFDAVGGGSLADRILYCMERAISAGAAYDPYGADVHKQVYLYGNLDRSATELRRVYGMSWGVGAWLMPRFLQRVGSERAAELRQRVAAGITSTFATNYTNRVSLVEALRPEAFNAYARPKTGSKFLITPSA